MDGIMQACDEVCGRKRGGEAMEICVGEIKK